ncbi:MAG: hypothetical protein RL199_1338 [Pseudomonadota bacterium]|jgi:chemotaxis protein methyltransferase CheR
MVNLASPVHDALGVKLRMTSAQFERLAAIVGERLGIRLSAERRSILEGRLLKVLAALRLPSVDALFETHLKGDVSAELLDQLVDHVTTSHTFFHRESHHLDHFEREALPLALGRRSKERDLRVWCAAAATGQEPYELAMIILDALGLDHGSWRAGLLATDVSTRALCVAREGRYTHDDGMRLPEARRKRHLKVEENGSWRVSDRLRDEVTFRQFNLLEPVYPFKRVFDAIFCRNVLMYFDEPTRDAVGEKLASVLAPGGFLYLGHTETLGRRHNRLVHIRPGLYRLGA